ncbi:hypothetical protein DM01DRAFT_1059365 [Hesseltinella vesiculosa]|uniref:Resolvase/invertase-type recombinase catalytic domain-containing protein n=1 Tax=Hesseltinella vesiculosa TaxID=101127 RepID=A0A1X2GFU2_9FUNG|nr:hypothetical protein DM01DRAFT_1059365 [Hesseltinella vesiculosa]
MSRPMTTVGYARKSPGKERFDARCSLLRKLVKRLEDRGLCTKVFISPSSQSDEPIMLRDEKKDNSMFLASISSCMGDMKNFRAMLNKKFKPVRLVVIDYAGLSTEPNDVRGFFRQYPQIKELVIDHGLTFEVIDRGDLLDNDDVLSRFDCRTSPKHRSA